MKALTKYVQSTKETDNNYELFLVTKAVDIKQRLENRTNGTLEIPEEQREEALRVRRNPKPGWFGTYTSVRKMRLFPHDPSPNDIKQRTTSDCYMMSALCSIAASQPEIIKQRMKDNGDTVTVKFFEKGTTNPVYITVKKEIPTYMLKVQKNAVDSLWVQMIEKAFAVYYGNAKVRDRRKEAGDDDGSRSYAALDYQDSFVFLSRFLGPDYSYENAKSLITLPEVITEDTIIENEDEQFKGIRIYNASMSDEYSGVATRLHEEWKKRLDSREVITVGISRNAENVAEAASKGYHTEHAYAVLKVFDVKVNKTGKTRRYVRLRDPYGAYSSDYDENKNKAVSTGNSFFMFDSTETMGTFDVEWNEFLNTFDNYCGCKVAACGSLVTAKVAEMASVKEKEIEDKMKKVQRDKIIQGQNNNANKIDDAGDDF